MVEIKLYSIQTKTPSPSKLNDFPFVYSLMNNDEKQKTSRKKKNKDERATVLLSAGSSQLVQIRNPT